LFKYNLDILAVPEYPSDAVSHWGLVIFTERALLHSPYTTSEVEHQRIALLIAKELAEQVRYIFIIIFSHKKFDSFLVVWKFDFISMVDRFMVTRSNC
jgi:hypothetical protein